jgi:hypothetical protein
VWTRLLTSRSYGAPDSFQSAAINIWPLCGHGTLVILILALRHQRGTLSQPFALTALPLALCSLRLALARLVFLAHAC